MAETMDGLNKAADFDRIFHGEAGTDEPLSHLAYRVWDCNVMFDRRVTLAKNVINVCMDWPKVIFEPGQQVSDGLFGNRE